MASTVTIVINVGFNGQGSYNSHDNFDGQEGNNSITVLMARTVTIAMIVLMASIVLIAKMVIIAITRFFASEQVEKGFIFPRDFFVG